MNSYPTPYVFASSTIEPTNYLTLVEDVANTVQEYAQTQLQVSPAADVTFNLFSIVDCGCYECETGLSAGPVNEGGQGECMASYDFVGIIVDGVMEHMIVVYNYVSYMRKLNA